MTLSFSWATNANYSTGPNSGTPTKVDPASTANGFVNGTIAAAQHINFLFDAVGDQIVKAVDGVGGGTYTLGSALRFQGADVEINAGLEILAAGEVNVQSGSALNILGAAGLNVVTGASAIVEGSVFVGGGGVLNVTTGGTAEIATAQQLTIGAAAGSFWSLVPVVQMSGGAMTWTPETRGRGWRQADVAGAFELAYPIRVVPGDSIVTVVVGVNGGVGAGHAGGVPAGADRLRVHLVRTDAAGTATVLATRADQSANAAAYDIDHTVTLASGSLDSGSLPVVTDSNHSYWVCVEGETGANAIANTTVVQAATGTTVARAYRVGLLMT